MCKGYMGTVGCDWTSKWNCPGQTDGIGKASSDNSLGYQCCCGQGLWRQSQAGQRQLVVSRAMRGQQTIQQTCTAEACACDKEEGVCMLWGDPHIYVLDGKRHIRILDNGDFWVVRSGCVSVQARYGPGGRNGESPSVIHAIAVGGSFLEGHVLAIEVGGNVTWDDSPILSGFPSSFQEAGLIDARYSGDSEHVDPGLGGMPVKSVEATLPLGVRLVVNRWPDHLDVLLAMRPLPGGQDGHCGNFNGDPTDDSAQLIKRRTGAEVTDEESLLPIAQQQQPASLLQRAKTQLAPELGDCPPDMLVDARERCLRVAPADRQET